MLLDGGVARVESPDNGGREERDTLHGDVVQEENEGDDDGAWREDTLQHASLVDLVQDDGGSHGLSLDAGGSKGYGENVIQGLVCCDG